MTKGNKNAPATKADIERQTGALLEEFQSRTELIAEQYLGVKETLDSHTEMIGNLAEDVTEIKHSLRKKVDYDDFEALEKRVISLEQKVASK